MTPWFYVNHKRARRTWRREGDHLPELDHPLLESTELYRRPSGVPVGVLLVGVGYVEDSLLVEGFAANLETDG